MVSAAHLYGTGIGGTAGLNTPGVLTPQMTSLPLALAAERNPYKHIQIGKQRLGQGQDESMSPLTSGGAGEYRGCLTNPNQHGGPAPAGAVRAPTATTPRCCRFALRSKFAISGCTQTLATAAGFSQEPHQPLCMGAQEVADAIAVIPPSAVRDQAGFMLIRRVGQADELYDLTVDPLELNNLFPPTNREPCAPTGQWLRASTQLTRKKFERP